MMEEAFIPCAGILSTLFLILSTVIVLRWIKHREVMALVTKGMLPEEYAGITVPSPRAGGGRPLLGWGIALAALGLALMLGLWPLAFFFTSGGRPYPLGFGPWMLIGLVPLFIGLALLVFYFVTRQENGVTETASQEMED